MGGDMVHNSDRRSDRVDLGGEAKTGGFYSPESLMIDVWYKQCQGDGGSLKKAGSDVPQLLFLADRGTQLL